MSIRHRHDVVETEPCLDNQATRGNLAVSSVSQGRRRPHLAILTNTNRANPSLVVAAAFGVVLLVCCWVEFRLGKVSSSILPGTARVEVDASFVREIQKAYANHIETACASSSSSSSSRRKHSCGTGSGGSILSIKCQDGRAHTAGSLVKKSLSAYKPTWVCANKAVSSMSSLSVQNILEQKYNMVLVESQSQSSEETHVHETLDFWRTMLLPRGILALMGTSEIVENDETLPSNRSQPTSMALMSWSSPELLDEYLSRVTSMYKSKICSPLNKQGLFCRGNILSLDCNHNSSLQLLQDYMPGRGTLYCPQNPQASSSSSFKSDVSPPTFQKQVPLEELLHHRYEAILLDASNNYPSNLELWSRLLVPGGITTISGTSTMDPIPSDEYLERLDLKAYYQSPTPPYFMIFVNTQSPVIDTATRNKSRQDETTVMNKFQPNQGSVNAQIQLSPVSFEDRYPTMYRSVANELLRNRPSVSPSCSKIRKKNDPTVTDSSSNSCGLIKVLSFGCSYGFEMKSLADKYLTGEADIYGVDVNDPVVAKAQENVKVVDSNKMVVLDGKTDPASNYGPFDAVFANSVLCYNRFPEPPDPVAKIKSMFTFATFEGLLNDIDVLVKVGGYLSLANTNYLFNETSLFHAKYQTYRDHDVPLCRQDVWLLSNNGTVIFNPHTDNRTAFTAYCVFVKVKE